MRVWMAALLLASPLWAEGEVSCDPVPALTAVVPSLATLIQSNPPTALSFELKSMGSGHEVDDRVDGVAYLEGAVKDSTRVYVWNGRLYDANGLLLQRTRSDFAMDRDGALYVYNPGTLKGLFIHHSSFTGLDPIASVGTIVVVDGIIIRCDNNSGHYSPSKKLFIQFQARLAELGYQLPLNRMFLFHGKTSLADPLPLPLFADRASFYQNIHNYDRNDQPQIIKYCLAQRSVDLREAAMRFISGTTIKEFDPVEARSMILMGLGDSAESVREEAASALGFFARGDHAADFTALVVPVVEGTYTAKVKGQAISALYGFEGKTEPFAFVEKVVEQDLVPGAPGLSAIEIYLYALRSHADLGPRAVAARAKCLVKINAIHDNKADAAASETARFILRDIQMFRPN